MGSTAAGGDKRNSHQSIFYWKPMRKMSLVRLLHTYLFQESLKSAFFRLLCAPLQTYLSTAGPSPMTATSAVGGIQVDTQQFASDLVTTGKTHHNINTNHIKYPQALSMLLSHGQTPCLVCLLFAFLCSAKSRQSCQWQSSSTPLSGGGFQFELPHSLSPYIEESTKLEVTAEAIQDFSIVRKTKTFYLRDISE